MPWFFVPWFSAIIDGFICKRVEASAQAVSRATAGRADGIGSSCQRLHHPLHQPKLLRDRTTNQSSPRLAPIRSRNLRKPLNNCLDAGFGQFFNILEQTCVKRGVYFQKVDSRKTSQICPSCSVETGKKELSQRTHACSNCSYTTDRDVAAAQVVAIRGLAAVGHTVKMLAEGKFIGIPVKQESSHL